MLISSVRQNGRNGIPSVNSIWSILHSDHKELVLHSRGGNNKGRKTNTGTLTNTCACAHTHTHTTTHTHRDAFSFYESKNKAPFTTGHRFLNLILGF